MTAPTLPPVSYDEHAAAELAIDEGRATELEHCFHCYGTLRGIVLRGVAGVADPTEWRQLTCGHIAL